MLASAQGREWAELERRFETPSPDTAPGTGGSGSGRMVLRAAPLRALLKRLRSGRSVSHCSWRWNSSSARERAIHYTVGEKIHGFTVNQVTAVPDLFLTAVKLNHDNTGAQYLHIARDDPNNLFSVQFRTTPLNSTGVPHILEHVVLCGSEKYQCRDPFFKMLNRSLSTFMNAFTASDYTMYPFSTQNSKDFQNLLSVYLDAVFFPCLRELDFWQTMRTYTLSTYRTSFYRTIPTQ
ncbi:presequence protease, mitochondrial isoform X2 [Heptranchias perlo]|uniref:presequence protease, mitochondrial isoform X2 n=1 Tax=Heptranchias perlo TaxID=212740 RepID=UPI00355989B4